MNLFVYGTLLVPEIWERVAGAGRLESLAAELPGYAIRRVRGEAFPGIFADPENAVPVPGRVVFDVPEASLRRLDAYEDAFYERIAVRPRIAGGEAVEAEAYVVPPGQVPAILGEEPWTLAWFERHGLADFRERVFGR